MKNRLQKSLCLLIVLISCYQIAIAQTPIISWQKTYGGSKNEFINNVAQTADSGLLLAGYTNSTDGDIMASYGNQDGWLIKTNALGIMQWQKSYGGGFDDQIIHAGITPDGGYICAGISYSNNGTVTGINRGNGDAWIMKLNDTGGIQWQKLMGGTGWDFANGAIPTADHGYIMTGGTYSANYDVTANHGSADVWVVKYDSSGNVLWNKTYGGSSDEWGFTIHQTYDGGYIIGSATYSTDGDIANTADATENWWALKIDDTGAIKWQKTYGYTGYNINTEILQTADSGYIMTGLVYGGVSNYHDNGDYWIVKTDKTGALVWQKDFGGAGYEQPGNIQVTADTGYIISGSTQSVDGDITDPRGSSDGWIIKLNSTGTLEWEKTVGGSGADTVDWVIQTYDKGFVLAGGTFSTDSGIAGNHGNGDYYLAKLYDSATQTAVHPVTISNENIAVYPTLTKGTVNINMPKGYEQAIVILTDINGRQMATANAQGLARKIQLQGIPAGTYLLTIRNGNEVNSFKIIYKP